MKHYLAQEHRPHTGVYYILNLRNDRIYIGATSMLGYRLTLHINRLNHNTHHNKALQNDWNTHGEQAFEYGVLVSVGKWDKDKELEIAKCERIFQHAYQSSDPRFGYNSSAARVLTGAMP